MQALRVILECGDERIRILAEITESLGGSGEAAGSYVPLPTPDQRQFLGFGKSPFRLGERLAQAPFRRRSIVRSATHIRNATLERVRQLLVVGLFHLWTKEIPRNPEYSSPGASSDARRSVSAFEEMPDDRDHRDDEEDVNKPTSHREDKEPQCPEND
jgi:hypothetical protein